MFSHEVGVLAHAARHDVPCAWFRYITGTAGHAGAERCMASGQQRMRYAAMMSPPTVRPDAHPRAQDARA